MVFNPFNVNKHFSNIKIMFIRYFKGLFSVINIFKPNIFITVCFVHFLCSNKENEPKESALFQRCFLNPGTSGFRNRPEKQQNANIFNRAAAFRNYTGEKDRKTFLEIRGYYLTKHSTFSMFRTLLVLIYLKETKYSQTERGWSR